MPTQTLGAELAHGLKARGVDTIFGIPGVHNVELYRGIEQAGITHVLARHEQGAGFMADGYARASGRPGVAFVISGPGLTNIMTPMGQAYSDSVPLLVISSCLPEGDTPGQLHQMKDQLGAGGAVAEWSALAPDGETAFQLIDQALEEFEVRRPRPKHITIPLDVLGKKASPVAQLPMTRPKPYASDNQVNLVASRLNDAKRPIVVFGGGAKQASDFANQMLAKCGAAAITTSAGRGVVAPINPQNFGGYMIRPESADIFVKADLVLAIGTELGETDLWRETLGHTCDLIRVDIDESALNDIHQADVKVRGEAADFLERLLPLLTKSQPKWSVSEVAATRQKFYAQISGQFPDIVALCKAMQSALPDDTMFYSDMTQFAYVALEVLDMARPGHWHHPFGFGTLGYALPAAIGAKIARADRPTIAIAGDYGFQYTMPELGVAAELGLTLPIILWDNGKLKEIEDCMIQSQIAPNAVVAQNPDFGLLAQAYGVNYTAPANVEAFQNALKASLTANRPTIIHVTPETAG